MKKNIYFFIISIFILSLSENAFSQDHSFVLGFNGVYRENSWTPLMIRVFNDGNSLSGQLIVETDNSSTAVAQKRQYIKPLDLPAGSRKAISFVIPIGYHSRDIHYYFISEDTVIFEETISLKQKGVQSNLILGVSPYPDLGFLSKYPQLDSRTVSYPHIDNLPDNYNAYDAVDIISMHREMMDKLTSGQFNAITGWVSQGGILVVWGGKSPTPAIWDYLPSDIEGLQKISFPQYSGSSILVNRIRTPLNHKTYAFSGYDLMSRRDPGEGVVFFVGFDYSDTLKDWAVLNEIWDIIFSVPKRTDSFAISMNEDYHLENYISIVDNSGFSYLDRKNVALILFLSASASVSMLIFIRFRRKSRHIYIYVFTLMIFLLFLSLAIFLSLFSDKMRTDCYIVSSNLIYQKGDSDHSRFYKDILAGATDSTSSDIILQNDTLSILKQKNSESIAIEATPEIKIKNIEMERWSSRIFRLESSIENILSISVSNTPEVLTLKIKNNSEYFINNAFIYFKENYHYINNIMPEETLSLPINSTGLNKNYENANDLAQILVNQYMSRMISEEKVILGGIINDEIHKLNFSNNTWRKKSVNLILATEMIKGDDN